MSLAEAAAKGEAILNEMDTRTAKFQASVRAEAAVYSDTVAACLTFFKKQTKREIDSP